MLCAATRLPSFRCSSTPPRSGASDWAEVTTGARPARSANALGCDTHGAAGFWLAGVRKPRRPRQRPVAYFMHVSLWHENALPDSRRCPGGSFLLYSVASYRSQGESMIRPAFARSPRSVQRTGLCAGLSDRPHSPGRGISAGRRVRNVPLARDQCKLLANLGQQS